MSILIKNMKMPTRCFDCPMCEISDVEICCSISIGVAVSYEEIDEKIAIQDRPSWCPLVELPPHGRLIDTNTLKVKHGWLDNFDNTHTHIQFVYANEINNAPTIIEAEECET